MELELHKLITNICRNKRKKCKDTMDPEEVYEKISELCSDYWVPRQIKVLENPTPFEFLRDAVSCYEPCIIRGAIDHWPILHNTLDELFSIYDNDDKNESKRVKVNITPDGHGDCVKTIDGVRTFVYPAETEMTLTAFKAMMLDRQPGDAVPYCSLQDNSLAKEFPELLALIDASPQLAADVFFNPEAARSASLLRGSDGEDKNDPVPTKAVPEAVNLWIGDERSVSSMHKDFFENLYCVVSGEKSFTLLPPADALYLRAQERTFPTATYVLNSDGSVADGKTVDHRRRVLQSDIHCNSGQDHLMWLDLDPAPGLPQPRLVEQHAHPLHVNVCAGEMLYLPAMWLHRVSQTRLTVAVNYWYEQRFDFRFVFNESVRAFRGILPPAHEEEPVGEDVQSTPS
jgi:peptidyl-lysine (3S)-dioxygenase / protease